MCQDEEQWIAPCSRRIRQCAELDCQLSCICCRSQGTDLQRNRRALGPIDSALPRCVNSAQTGEETPPATHHSEFPKCVWPRAAEKPAKWPAFRLHSAPLRSQRQPHRPNISPHGLRQMPRDTPFPRKHQTQCRSAPVLEPPGPQRRFQAADRAAAMDLWRSRFDRKCKGISEYRHRSSYPAAPSIRQAG